MIPSSTSRTTRRRRRRTPRVARTTVRRNLVEAAVQTVTADPRLSLSRSQQEGLAGTRTRRRTSRRRARERNVIRDALDSLGNRQAGPTGSRAGASPEVRARSAAQDFMRGRGPMAQRTADTPWQERMRPVRRRERVARQFAERDFGPRSGPTQNLIDAAIQSLYGRLPATSQEAIALNQRNALEPADDDGWSYPDIAGWLGGKIKQHVADPIARRLADELGFGGDSDATGPMRIGNRTVSLVPAASRSNVIGRDLANAGAESSTRRAVGETLEAAGIPGLAIEQLAESFLYTPAFVAELLTDPKSALRGVYETARYAVEHPTERPGDLVALVWGFGGGVKGAMSRLSDLRTSGPRAAAMPRPSSRRVPGASMVPGTAARTARRERAVIADLREAEPAAYERIAKRPVIGRITAREARDAGLSKRPTGRRERDMRISVQDEAIRAQFDQVTPQERLAHFEREFDQAKTASERRSIRKKIDANKIVIARGLVDGEPGNVRVVEPRLAELAENLARMSDETGGAKALLGITDEAVQAEHLYTPGRIIRDQDRIPGTRAGVPALADATPVRLVPGQTYGSYKMDIAGRPPSVPTRVASRIGLRRAPSSRRMTGETLRKGTYGDIVRMTAREALEVAKYKEWLELWKEAVPQAKTAMELLNEVASGRASLDDYIPVRIGPGDTTAAAKLGIRVATDPKSRVTSFFGVLDDYAVENFQSLAEQIDRNGVFGFVHKDIGVEPVMFTKRGFLRTVPSAINQLARTAVFTAGLTAWVVPNVIGQAAATLLHQGLATVPNIFWSAKKIRQVPKGLQRQKFYRELDAIGGTGIVKATDPGGGPMQMFGRLNDVVGEQLARVMDTVWRRNATMYEFWLRGYDDPRAIMAATAEAKRSPQGKSARDVKDVAEAVDQNYGAFRHLSDYERNTITDVIFIYPWLRASAELAAKFPVNHPVKASALALGGTHANEKARQDFIDMFLEQGMSRKDAEDSADHIMSRMPGIFVMGDSAISPLSIALLSTPGEIINAIGPFTRGEWKRGVFNLLDFGSPAVGLFMAGMTSLLDQYSEGLGPEVQEAMSSYARDVTLIQRLQEGGSAWFSFTPEQAIGARAAGSFFPRGVKGEGLLESVRYEQERNAVKPAQGYEESDFHRNRETRGTVFNRGERLAGNLRRLRNDDLTPDELEFATTALNVEFELENRLARARKGGRLNFWAASKAVRDYAVELFPRDKQVILDYYKRQNNLERRKVFYEDVRDEIRKSYPWGEVHSYLEGSANG